MSETDDMPFIHNLISAYSRRRFALLFFSLLITMMAAPVLGAMGLNTRFTEVFLGINIVAAVLVTVFTSRIYAGLAFFALLAARVGSALLGYQPLMETSQAIGVLICVMSAVIMLRFILSEGFVTSERIFAALSVHLLIGMICALLFCIIVEQWPGSFFFQGSSFTESKQNVMAHMIYFTFVTLGTLGYGDIIPVSGPARALAVTESIIGQMYLAVVVRVWLVFIKEKPNGRWSSRPCPTILKSLSRIPLTENSSDLLPLRVVSI